jgi:hypothetical protein
MTRHTSWNCARSRGARKKIVLTEGSFPRLSAPWPRVRALCPLRRTSR